MIYIAVIYIAVWIVGAALTYWLDECEGIKHDHRQRRGARRDVAIVSLVAWPCAMVIYLLDALGLFGDDDGGDDA